MYQVVHTKNDFNKFTEIGFFEPEDCLELKTNTWVTKNGNFISYLEYKYIKIHPFDIIKEFCFGSSPTYSIDEFKTKLGNYSKAVTNIQIAWDKYRL